MLEQKLHCLYGHICGLDGVTLLKVFVSKSYLVPKRNKKEEWSNRG